MILTEVGLEWTDSKGRDRRMPFACMRLIAFTAQCDRLRISGPPGRVWVGPDKIELAPAIVSGALQAGCRVRLRKVRFPHIPGLGLVWARLGREIPEEELPSLENPGA